ncbi:hypothetical protein [Tropicibacter oceani]|uniref:Uncharacterized protein n=1 Tax=Tropicibacter oceani TaxID=3058420 RepID=A0ABY8QF50_9RHOB|nr:hypothetical protein [Tropicibacter oceani]WGW02631.1 hypothetical protein QF118_11840 [Tropicibacter oceani]
MADGDLLLTRRPPLAQSGPPVSRFDPALEAWLNAMFHYWGCDECVVLPKVAVNAMRTVGNWRRGASVIRTVLPPGTPVATFLTRQGAPSDRWDGGQGLGITGNFTTHSGVLAGYLLDAHGALIGIKIWELYPGCGRVRRRIYPLDDTRFGTANARNYHAIHDLDGAPLGGPDNPSFALWQQSLAPPPRSAPPLYPGA